MPLSPNARTGLLAVAIVGVLFLACGGAVGGYLLWWKGTTTTPSAAISSSGQMSREAFRKAVINKTGPEIIKTIGRPDEAEDAEGGQPLRWTYRDRVLNPNTQKPQTAVIVFGADGRGSEVRWD
jgi:hypothetical protein